MPPVSIIIPVYNALDAVAKCLESVYRARTEVPFEVVVVDNGSSPCLDEHIGAARAAYANLRVIRFEDPLGFPRAVNEGTRRARHEYFVLLNSDTVVGDGWLDRLLEALLADPGLAVVSPVTNRCGHEAQMAASGGPGIVPEAQSLNFFSIMIPRAVWERLGGVDEIYKTGYFEDDDFCLRARLAGYRLAIVPSVFVAHEADRTFAENGLNQEEVLARNQAVFQERASRWSRSLPPQPARSIRGESISVIVPVWQAAWNGLRDSLISLCNQTIGGFETVVVHSAEIDVAPAIAGLDHWLTIATKAVAGTPDSPAGLLNAGLAAARGRRIAYLLPGDVFYPFHLEVLTDALDRRPVEAVYSAWSIYSEFGGRKRRGAVAFDQMEPVRLPWGDWAPLMCWMHEQSATPAGGFDESFRHFFGWHFILQLAGRRQFQYLRRITTERRVVNESSHSRSTAAQEAQRILGQPQAGWQEQHRKLFVEAVGKGLWELWIIERNEMQRRARRLYAESAVSRLAAMPPPATVRNASGLPNIFLFSINEWDGLTQRPHYFARGLVSRGFRVFWIDVRLKQPRLVNSESLSFEVAPGVHYVELPGNAGTIYELRWTRDVLEMMSLTIQCIAGHHPSIQLVTYPKWKPLAVKLRDRFGWPIVYDCLDDHRAFSELNGLDAADFEDDLIQASELVIATARVLLERYSGRHPNTIQLPNAVDFKTFHDAKANGVLDHLRRPVIGYFGAFSDWLDFDWIREAARTFAEWSFVYIGLESLATIAARRRWKEATNAPNIHVFPPLDPPTLATCLVEFDVCIMPFQDLPITRAANPVKIFEYLAAGKPVVVPDLPETRPFAARDLIAIYNNREESFLLLRQAVNSPGSEEQIAARVAFAAANNWSKRLDELATALLGLAWR